MATPTNGLDMRSKSPRSLQSRNTKNLSLSIQDTSASSVAEFEDAQGVVPNGVTKPIRIGRGKMENTSADRTLQSRRTEASIYSLPTERKSGSTSPIFTVSGQRASEGSAVSGNKIGRVHSLSLSVKTKELRSGSLARERARTLNSAFETSTPKMCHFGTKIDDTNTEMDLSCSDAIKVDAYPAGPLLVIPPNVYLYSEPLVEEILDFDVVINVAKEVPNLTRFIPMTKDIAYHHVEWGHNSKISTDLDYLTSLIHEASSEGKKVLIHCQCGVSRSASLIVAYIMRYHDLGLNDAYSHVKAVAKDISPNMSLIFQLMEWNELRSKTPREPQKAEPFHVPIPSASLTNELTIVSPEATPRTPGEYFNKVSVTSSSSSASTSSSTIVGNQSQSKPITLPSDLGTYLSADIPAPSSADSFWS